jgi:RNA recognition motif-containing protein
MRIRIWSLAQRCYTTPNRLKARTYEHFSAKGSAPHSEPAIASRRIFVANLPSTVDWKELKDYFQQIGTVGYASVSKDMVTNQSKGCGLVQFETRAHVQKAIELLHGKIWNGKAITVREDIQEKKPKLESVERDRGRRSSEAKAPTPTAPSPSSRRAREGTAPREEGGEGRRAATATAASPTKKPKEALSEEQRAQHRVFVSGLPLTYNWMNLKDYFKAVGPVMGSGKSKGSAVVEFERRSDVAKAVRLLHGAVIEPELMMIRVEPFEVEVRADKETSTDNPRPDSGSRSSSPSSSSRNQRLIPVPVIAPLVPILRQTPLPEELKRSIAVLSDTRVFVNHLPRDLDWKIVKDTFSAIGPVVHVEILPDPRTGKSRGCGFVKYRLLSDAKRAIETLHLSELEGKQIEVGEYLEERESRRDRAWRRNTFMKIRLPDESAETERRLDRETERAVGREIE